MNSFSSRSTDMFNIVLMGKSHFKNAIGHMILNGTERVVSEVNNFVVKKNDTFKIIISPDISDDQYLSPDQRIIDLMALSHPGPHRFILAIDKGSSQSADVFDQVHNLQTVFGENIKKNLTIVTDNSEMFTPLGSLNEIMKIPFEIISGDLAQNLKRQYSGHQSFSYDYNHYLKYAVERRKKELMSRISTQYNCHHPPHHNCCTNVNHPSPSSSRNIVAVAAADGIKEYDEFNIVLVGKSGTGKSKSAKTILVALNPRENSKHVFKSQISSLPVTTRCEAKTVRKFDKQITVVDTPDFVDGQLDNCQAVVEECKKYCQRGRCIVLLVIQLGRFTDEEVGILEKLEKLLGWEIRRSTVVLMTHGEGFNDSVPMFISERTPLKHIVQSCGDRYHIFKNTSKDPKQVTDLLSKFSSCETIFPNLAEKRKQMSDCLLC